MGERVPTEVATAPPRLELRDGALSLAVGADGNLAGLRPASRRSCASAPKPRCRAGASPNLPLSTIYVGLLAP